MNLILEANCDLLGAAVYETRTTPDTVNETITGAKVEGQAISYTVAGVEFCPDDHKASLEMVLRGKIVSQTVATKGPVRTYNSNWGTFVARKPVCITSDGLSWSQASAGVRQDSHLNCLEVKPKGLAGAITRQVALVAYEHDKEKARAEGEYKAGVRIVESFDEEGGKELAKQNKDFHQRLLQRLEKKNLLSQPLQFRTTKELLILLDRLADEDQPPSITPPPAVQGVPALALRLHQSLVNTAGTRMYSGQTRDRAGFRQDLKDLGLVDEDEKNNDKERTDQEKTDKEKTDKEKEPEEDFEITFAKKDPITAIFDDQRVKVTIRNTRFKRADEKAYSEPWQTTITFKLSKTDKGFRLVREGEIDPVPLDRKTMEPTAMSGIKTAERRALIRLFQRNLKDEYTMDEIKPTGDLKKIGTLESTQGETSNGWLLLAWKRNPQGQ
jgi:hypothetical protein